VSTAVARPVLPRASAFGPRAAVPASAVPTAVTRVAIWAPAGKVEMQLKLKGLQSTHGGGIRSVHVHAGSGPMRKPFADSWCKAALKRCVCDKCIQDMPGQAEQASRACLAAMVAGPEACIGRRGCCSWRCAYGVRFTAWGLHSAAYVVGHQNRNCDPMQGGGVTVATPPSAGLIT